MTKLAPAWVRTIDPVIRSPARYRWTTAPGLVEGGTVFICDAVESSILMLTSCEGMSHFLLSIGNMFDAFQIHRHTKCSIGMASKKLLVRSDKFPQSSQK